MLKLGQFEIGSGRCFVIAEIGNNHQGDFARAKHMIDEAKRMGADCAKFQMRHLSDVYRKRTLKKDGEDLGTEYILDLLNRFELTVEQHRELARYCEQVGILYLCTPWDETSVAVLESIGVAAYKVASADLTNFPLIDRLCRTGKVLVLSTGMSTRTEIQNTIDFLNAREARFVLLHCNSAYPAPIHDIHLKWMGQLNSMHPYVGYSGHERGMAVTLAAVARGAMVVERHFTLDRTMEGPDHAASLEFEEFKNLIDGIREIEEALGSDATERSVSQGEMINRENLAKSLVAASDMRKGTVLGAEHIRVRSPGQGLSPQHYEKLLGQTLSRDMEEEDFFYASDLSGTRVEPKNYRFRRPWGVPVRYHDFAAYAERITPDIFEFHLSYSDMELDPAEYMRGTYEAGFVVHAPELFSQSRLMDLASPDETYRKESIFETQRVIDITRGLKKYFPNTKRPMIVANIGGFTMDALLPAEVIPEYYARFAQSLAELDMEGVELIPQTMAPFPWHFGGQRYQNLFMRIDESVEQCKKMGLRMCLDVSHTKLTCNHLGVDFYEAMEKLGSVASHIHIGDATGLNGEGLQVGEGEIDFVRLGAILDKQCPQASFIPEIWQGHKNAGEGFWIALERLEGSL